MAGRPGWERVGQLEQDWRVTAIGWQGDPVVIQDSAGHGGQAGKFLFLGLAGRPAEKTL